MDSTIIAVIVGAVLTSIGTWLNNLHTSSLQTKQWRREDEKIERERRRQIDEQRELQKQQIIDNYAKALTHISIFFRPNTPLQNSGYKSIQEIQPYLLQIILDYPNKKSNTYVNFRTLVEKLIDNEHLSQHITELRRAVIVLAQEDSRLWE